MLTCESVRAASGPDIVPGSPDDGSRAWPGAEPGCRRHARQVYYGVLWRPAVRAPTVGRVGVVIAVLVAVVWVAVAVAATVWALRSRRHHREDAYAAAQAAAAAGLDLTDRSEVDLTDRVQAAQELPIQRDR